MCTDPSLYSLKNSRSMMIDRLIHTAANIIDSIWLIRTNVISTACFIKEILKRSRATFSMLHLALFYLFRMKNAVQDYLQKEEQDKYKGFVCCGRRMFLAALMTASKYLNDRNYRNKTWAKIACLPLHEMNKTEYIFLSLIQFNLYVSKPLYDKWVYLLHHHIQKRDNPFIDTYAIQPHIDRYTLLASPVSLYQSSPDTHSIISTPSPPLITNEKRPWTDLPSITKHVKYCK